MIKILTTKQWRALLDRIGHLEQEVKTLRYRADNAASLTDLHAYHIDQQRNKVKRIERDIRNMRKTIDSKK